MKSEAPSITTAIDTNDSDSQPEEPHGYADGAVIYPFDEVACHGWQNKIIGTEVFDTEIDIRGAAWRADENRRKQYDAVVASANCAGIFRFACANCLRRSIQRSLARSGLVDFSRHSLSVLSARCHMAEQI